MNIPNGVFKAVVGCSWVNKVAPSKLLDVSKSLELRGVNDFDEKWVQLHMPVDGIIKHLAGHTEKSPIITLHLFFVYCNLSYLFSPENVMQCTIRYIIYYLASSLILSFHATDI